MRAECPCAVIFDELEATHHDWLLSIETRGIVGVSALLDHVSLDVELEHVPGTLRWFELEEFVACHNWEQPVAMLTVSRWILQMIRRGERLDRIELPQCFDSSGVPLRS